MTNKNKEYNDLIKKLPTRAPIFLPTDKVPLENKISGLKRVKEIYDHRLDDVYRPKLKKLRSKYKDTDRCFIIGNGPSINKTDLSFLKNEITFAVNGFFLKQQELDWNPTFYVVEDHLVAEDRQSKINGYKGPVKLFPVYLAYCLNEGDDTIFFNHRPRKSFPDGFDFSTNAADLTYAGCTVTYTCMQLAFYFGFKEIYLIGVDASYKIPEDVEQDFDYSVGVLNMKSDDINHFHPDYFGKGYRWHDPQVDKMIEAYKEAKRVTSRSKQEIINATIGGKLEVFRRLDYSNIFLKPKKNLDTSYYPRLLIFDATMVGDGTATGELKKNLLGDWPKKKLLQVYEIENQLCITNFQELNKFSVDNKNLFLFIKKFKPEVVLYRPISNTPALHQQAMKFINNLNISIVSWIMDDWLMRLKGRNISRFIKLDRDYRELLRLASINLCISEAMKIAFEERYSKTFHPLANGIDLREWQQVKKKNNRKKMIIRYSGSLDEYMTLNSIIDIAKAIENIGKNNNVVFEINTRTMFSNKIKYITDELKHTKVFTKLMPENEYRQWLVDADILIIAYNFDKKSIEYVQYSLANKLPECMASRVPIFAYGPEKNATLNYLKLNECAQIVNHQSLKTLEEQLLDLLNDKEKQLNLVNKSLDIVKKNHDLLNLRRSFNEHIVTAKRSIGSDKYGGGTINIVFFPIFSDESKLIDHYFRLHWYLYPLRKYISCITLFCDCDYSLQSPPSYLNNELDNIRKNWDIVNIVRVKKESDYKKIIKESDVVVIWDSKKIGKIPLSIKNLIKDKEVVKVDHDNEQNAGSFYLKLAELFPNKLQLWTEQSKQVFSEIYNKCKSHKGYIFGTGPSLSLAKNHNFLPKSSIVCNSMVRNRKLLDKLQPSIIVMADPIFHAGPSSYSAKFREALIDALDAYNSYLIVPMRDYHIYSEYLPSRFHERICGIPYKIQSIPNLDLSKNFFVTSTNNISTLFLIPLASTLFKEVEMSGFDGRPLDEDKYFWKFDPSSQFNDQMESIKEAHPAFFNINYNDYYLKHSNTMENWLNFAEKQGCKYTSITPSHIPSLRERYKDFLLNDHGLNEIIMLDPDGLSDMGHFISMNDCLNHACLNKNIRFSVFSNINCSKNIIDSRSYYYPVFSVHSWDVRREGEEHYKLIKIFSNELNKALLHRADSGISYQTNLYMYCGSLMAAKAISDVIQKFNNVSATICLFWTSNYNHVSYISKWKKFFKSCQNNTNINLIAPTKSLSENFKKISNLDLPILPHPSTSFSDKYALSLAKESNIKKSKILKNKNINVIFPGGVSLGKGIDITADIITNKPKKNFFHSDQIKSNINFIVRLTDKDYKDEIQKYVDKIKKADCIINQDFLNDKQFADFLKTGDVAILPYQSSSFKERTSGLLVDLLYLEIPVIVFEATWLSEIVNKYKFGIIVKKYDKANFYKALEELLLNYDLYKQNIRKARHDYFKNNSWEGVVNFLIQQNNKVYAKKQFFNFSRKEKASIDESQLIAELCKDLPANSVMIDVGAHHGSSLRHFNRLNWNIFAFEPDIQNRKKLNDLYGNNKQIKIDSRALSDKAQKNIKFYTSKQSKGISSILSFHDSHEESGSVDVTTIANIIKENKIQRINFLKIDVEGYDLNVLKGVPWNKIIPDVIECEFEDAKTKILGHSWKDISDFLIDKGYTVYVSEWHPVIRYGISHDWRGIQRYPCALKDENSFGNLLAFKDDPGLNKINKLAGRLVKHISNNKKENFKFMQICSLSNFKFNVLSNYVRFAMWARENNQAIYILGRIFAKGLRYIKRYLLMNLVLGFIFFISAFSANTYPALTPFKPYILGVSFFALVLIFAIPSFLLLHQKYLFIISKLNRIQENLNSKLITTEKELSNKLSTTEKELSNKLSTTEKKLNTSHKKFMDLREEFKKYKPENMPFNNFSNFVAFKKTLSPNDIEIFINKWSKLLDFDYSPRALHYFAHRINYIETISKGRLAVTIEDALLRVLAAGSIKDKKLNILEIGTLFGVGLTTIYDYVSSRFDDVLLTAIDPLDGYYKQSTKDLYSGELVNEDTLKNNFALIPITKNKFTLIKNLSTDDNAVKKIGKEKFNYFLIDGDHSYNGIKNDFEIYKVFLKKNALIIVDDFNNIHWPDVTRYVENELMKNPNLKFIGSDFETAIFRVEEEFN